MRQHTLTSARNSLTRAFLSLALALVGTTGLASPARAASDVTRRVAIDAFRGPQGAVLQDAVESALLREYHLVPGAVVNEAARRSGVHMRSDEDFAEMGRSLNVAAFVSATTVKRNKKWRVEMVVRNGETGEAVARYDLTERRIEMLAAALARSAPRRLQVLLASKPNLVADDDQQVRTRLRPQPFRPAETEPQEVKPPKEVKSTRDVKKAKDDDDDSAEAATADDSPEPPRAAKPFIELAVGGRVFSRSMSFTDNFSQVPAYRLERATAITVDMAFHPFALMDGTRNTRLAGLGVTGNVTYALGISTELSGSSGRSHTEVHGYEGGLRYRAQLGVVELFPRVAYLAETFAANVGGLSPDVNYQVVRAGLAAQVPLSARGTMRASVDYLAVLSAGRLADQDRFPRAVSRGLDVSIGGGYGFSDSVEAWASVGLRRYGFDMKSRPGDSLIAGGAIDEYVSVTMGLTYRPTLGGI